MHNANVCPFSCLLLFFFKLISLDHDMLVYIVQRDSWFFIVINFIDCTCSAPCKITHYNQIIINHHANDWHILLYHHFDHFDIAWEQLNIMKSQRRRTYNHTLQSCKTCVQGEKKTFIVHYLLLMWKKYVKYISEFYLSLRINKYCSSTFLCNSKH